MKKLLINLPTYLFRKSFSRLHQFQAVIVQSTEIANLKNIPSSTKENRKMPEEFQCRFCPESYQEVVQFLDHFETHMNQQEQNQNKQQSSIRKESEAQIQNEEAKSPKSIDQMTNTRLEDENRFRF